MEKKSYIVVQKLKDLYQATDLKELFILLNIPLTLHERLNENFYGIQEDEKLLDNSDEEFKQLFSEMKMMKRRLEFFLRERDLIIVKLKSKLAMTEEQLIISKMKFDEINNYPNQGGKERFMKSKIEVDKKREAIFDRLGTLQKTKENELIMRIERLKEKENDVALNKIYIESNDSESIPNIVSNEKSNSGSLDLNTCQTSKMDEDETESEFDNYGLLLSLEKDQEELERMKSEMFTLQDNLRQRRLEKKRKEEQIVHIKLLIMKKKLKSSVLKKNGFSLTDKQAKLNQLNEDVKHMKPMINHLEQALKQSKLNYKKKEGLFNKKKKVSKAWLHSSSEDLKF